MANVPNNIKTDPESIIQAVDEWAVGDQFNNIVTDFQVQVLNPLECGNAFLATLQTKKGKDWLNFFYKIAVFVSMNGVSGNEGRMTEKAKAFWKSIRDVIPHARGTKDVTPLTMTLARFVVCFPWFESFLLFVRFKRPAVEKPESELPIHFQHTAGLAMMSADQRSSFKSAFEGWSASFSKLVERGTSELDTYKNRNAPFIHAQSLSTWRENDFWKKLCFHTIMKFADALGMGHKAGEFLVAVAVAKPTM